MCYAKQPPVCFAAHREGKESEILILIKPGKKLSRKVSFCEGGKRREEREEGGGTRRRWMFDTGGALPVR